MATLHGCFKTRAIASDRRGFSATHSSLLLKDKEFYINKFLEKERLVTHCSIDARARAGPYVTYIDYTFYAVFSSPLSPIFNEEMIRSRILQRVRTKLTTSIGIFRSLFIISTRLLISFITYIINYGVYKIYTK